MRVQVNPARNGARWMSQGVRAFGRQPVRLSALFLIYMALMKLIAIVPVVGSLLGLTLFPLCSLALMVVAHETSAGRSCNMRLPTWGLLSQFARRGPLLYLGFSYALCVVLMIALTALADGGAFATMYFQGNPVDMLAIEQPGFIGAALLCMVLYMPLSALFWHAPALVYWHNVPVFKSLFFSLMACLSNWRALLVYSICFSALSLAVLLVTMALGVLLGFQALVVWVLPPAVLLVTTMYFTAAYFTFKDSFDVQEAQPQDSDSNSNSDSIHS